MGKEQDSWEIRELADRIGRRLHLMENQEAVQPHLPNGWEIEASTVYDGGSLTLSIHGTTVLTIERDVEFRRNQVTVPEVFAARLEKLIRFVEGVSGKIEAAAEAVREAERMAEAARIIALIDAEIENLPEP
ncbi:hypothetical protein LAZ40_07160 [Cereibacter sphaeroides]|uniref:hypothetical protein n=1 Tax=Cereibacter sphaeroides TaxID=1063 RepID=UPI001F229BB2|nr:hypothetical protein [Cereibacter sphaeroides]MCE6958826.1 hypothetical protein [Cereibacter sphaeroides]MCE6973300.1 hypothetical protein [Cereibacter sphaeroides]